VDVDTGIPEARRKEIAEALARLLADTYSLYLETQYYHWNVTGPRFRELHLLFEEQYGQLAEAADEIAERIRTLGFWAPGTFAEFSRLSSVAQEERVPEAEGMLHTLLQHHEVVLRTVREVLSVAEQAGDAATSDLATARIRYHEKTGWMLAATA
jgi:starvation-inducible DNA-binding protein